MIEERMALMDKQEQMARLSEIISKCRCCDLCKTRTNVVPGEGDLNSPVMFVGEGPGHDEDVSGRPFVGKAGQLLDKMLDSVGISRESVYICNIVKCRPPGNRNPSDEEQDACIRYLRAQFALIRPQIVVCLGAVSARRLIDPHFGIMRDHGKWYEKKGVQFTAIFHPSFLLRENSDQLKHKRETWQELILLAEKLNKIKDH